MRAPCTSGSLLCLLGPSRAGIVTGPGAGMRRQPGQVVVVGVQLRIVLGRGGPDRDPYRPADRNRRSWDFPGRRLRLGRRRLGATPGDLHLAVPEEDDE